MISGRELAYGLVGAWRLMRNDPGGLQHFDRTPAGALRSFRVMLLVAPAYAVLGLMQLDSYGVQSIGLHQILLSAGIYVIDWLLFPVIVLRLAPLLGRAQEAPGFVCANNWAQIIIYALALFLGASSSLLPEPIAQLLSLVLLGVVAVIEYRLLRHAMSLSPPQAALFVVLYISLGVMLNAIFFTMLTASQPLA